jgi:hypothetical protein
VLVVADEVAFRVGGQRGLAGAGKAEEQRDAAIFADVGGAVHGQHVLAGQQEVLHGEHGFLHFTGVVHAGNQHLALGEIQDDAAVGIGAVAVGQALEAGGVDHLPFIFLAGVVFVGRDEEVLAEQAVPGGFGGDLHRQVMLRVGAHVQVGDELVAFADVALHALPQRIELVGGEGLVHRAPVDALAGAGLVDDEAVGGRAAGAVAGVDRERAVVGQMAFLALHGEFDELGAGEILVDLESGHGSCRAFSVRDEPG